MNKNKNNSNNNTRDNGGKTVSNESFKNFPPTQKRPPMPKVKPPKPSK